MGQGSCSQHEYTKSLFIRFKATSALDDLNRQLRRAAKLSVRALRDPHVSLLYANVPLPSKRNSRAQFIFHSAKLSSIRSNRALQFFYENAGRCKKLARSVDEEINSLGYLTTCGRLRTGRLTNRQVWRGQSVRG